MKVKARISILFIAKVAILCRCSYAKLCQFSLVDCVEYEAKKNKAYYEGSNICSANEEFQLGMTGSGNLCACDMTNPDKPFSSEIWCANISGGDFMILQNDGNFVVYRNDDNFGKVALWSTRSAGNKDPFLRINNEGAVILSIITERILWSSPKTSSQSATILSKAPPQEVSPIDSITKNSNRINIYIVGDTPYHPDELPILESRTKKLPTDADVLVHLGDIKRGNGASCALKHYTSVAKELHRSHAPVFIVPGDNDVNDCKRFDEGWNNWAETFLSQAQLPENRWDTSNIGPIKRQRGTANFAFVYKRALIIGVDVPGGAPHDRSWWYQHYKTTLNFVMNQVENYTVSNHKESTHHAILILGHGRPQTNNKNFFRPLKSQLSNNSKVDMDRVLYVHGDGHKPQTNYLYGFKCVQVDLGRRQWLRLKVDADQKDPFEYKHGVFLD